jgi:hypothetical protein
LGVLDGDERASVASFREEGHGMKHDVILGGGSVWICLDEGVAC